MANPIYVLHQGDIILMEGCEEDVREKIEVLLEEATGIFVSLQEEVDEDQFDVCLHSDNWDDESTGLEFLQEHLKVELGDDAAVDAAIKKLLNIRITEKQVVTS